MSFSQYLRENVKLTKIGDTVIFFDRLCAQYNPDRFDLYCKSIGNCPGNPLSVSNMPHRDLLMKYIDNKNGFWKHFKENSYYRMQHLYGRDDTWIKNKIEKFISLYEDISNKKLRENIVVLSAPIIPNRYNRSYEIYEGHHRTACIAVGMKSITAQLYEAKITQ